MGMHNSRKLQFEHATLMDCAPIPITFESALMVWCECPLGQVVDVGSWSSMVCAVGRMSLSLTTFMLLDSYQFIGNQIAAQSGAFVPEFS
jgi:hypothetical protein